MKRCESLSKSRRVRGFMLLEAMLAVAIFAISVLALGRCVAKGMAVQQLAAEDERACRVLENREKEIEARAVAVASGHEVIADINGGLTLTQTNHKVTKKDEHGQVMGDLYLVTLEAAWNSDGARQARTLSFYVWTQKL